MIGVTLLRAEAKYLQIFTLSVISITLLVNPKLQGFQWRGFRVGSFIATALTGFAPIFHGVYIHGFEKSMVQSGMPYYFAEGFLFLLDAAFYMVSKGYSKVNNSLMA